MNFIHNPEVGGSTIAGDPVGNEDASTSGGLLARAHPEPDLTGASNPGKRFAGESEARLRQGLRLVGPLAFLRFGLVGPLAFLRFGRMFRFAAVGAFGTVLNLAIMASLLGQGAHYLLAAIVATEVTILSNFLMQEHLVFGDLRDSRPFWQRILASFGFNNIETLVRIPVLMLLVEALLIPGVLAQAVTLAVAFLVRFAFTSRVIYRVRPPAGVPVPVPATPITPAGVEIA